MQLEYGTVLGVQSSPTCKILNADSNTIRGGSREFRRNPRAWIRDAEGSFRFQEERTLEVDRVRNGIALNGKHRDRMAFFTDERPVLPVASSLMDRLLQSDKQILSFKAWRVERYDP